MKLLSVDWDYFFPKVEDPSQAEFRDQWWMYDWGHRESRLFIHALWPHRAADFVRNKLTLPGTTGDERTFWSRFQIKPRATLYVAESHAWAAEARVLRNLTSVWSFDAHHDCGYHSRDEELKQLVQPKGGLHVSCDNWLMAYQLLGIDDIHIRYPRWRAYWPEAEKSCAIDHIERLTDDANQVPTTFDRVFLCRSGAWTPPWIDEAFRAFIAAAPVRRTIYVQDIEDRSGWRAAMEDDLRLMEEFERQQSVLKAARVAMEKVIAEGGSQEAATAAAAEAAKKAQREVSDASTDKD